MAGRSRQNAPARGSTSRGELSESLKGLSDTERMITSVRPMLAQAYDPARVFIFRMDDLDAAAADAGTTAPM